MQAIKYQQSSFLPNFCEVQTVFLIVLIAELLAIVVTLVSVSPINYLLNDLALNSLFIQWISLTSTAVLCMARRTLNSLPDHWAAILSYGLILMITLVITEISWRVMYTGQFRIFAPVQSHMAFLLRCVTISAIVSAIALRYFYIQHQWRRHFELESQFRLQALHSRIRPHFLFNCMNTIASLIRTDPVRAEESIEDLADLFRVSLREETQMSTLDNELLLCKRYLRIETQRLGKRLQVVWNIEKLPGNTLLPALTIQPLIENAIYHGIETLQSGGCINIKGTQLPDRLLISIDNPLPSTNDASNHDGNQMALDNIRQRLTASLGSKADLQTRIQDQRYIAEVIIPLRYEDTDR